MIDDVVVLKVFILVCGIIFFVLYKERAEYSGRNADRDKYPESIQLA